MWPLQDSITKVPRMFWLSGKASRRGRSEPTRHRNICIALGCIAEKLAGPTSVALLTDGTLDYLIANLVSPVAVETQPNLSQPNPTYPNPTQPIPTQPNPT